MRTLLITVLSAILLSLVGLGAVQDHPSEHPQSMPAMPMMQNSPMHGQMIPFVATVEDVPDGVRITLTPKDPAKLEEFRSSVRKHVENMSQGGCDMMRGMIDHQSHHPQ